MADKTFPGYRQTEIRNHLIELSKVNFLIIDTEQDEDLKTNIETIMQFITSPEASPSITAIVPEKCIPSIEDAMTNTAGFRLLLARFSFPPIPQAMAVQPAASNVLTPEFQRISLPSSSAPKTLPTHDVPQDTHSTVMDVFFV